MKEEEVHAIWAGLKFDRTNLKTTTGQPIKIIQVGNYNLDQGPDFLQAKIAIGKVVFEGHVEIHVEGADWFRHKHQLDPNYDAVILHVVMRQSKQAPIRSDGTEIPELVIGKLHKTKEGPGQMQTRLPCTGLAAKTAFSNHSEWLQAMAGERLALKLRKLEARLEFLKWDWQQLIWEELCRNFGGPVNAEAFWEISQIATWRVVRKYPFKTEALEALLMGVAGLLEGRPPDARRSLLKTEWEFLREKHQLKALHFSLKQHRMRPASMPLTRIALLAAVVRAHTPLVQFLEPGMHPIWMDTCINSDVEGEKAQGLGLAQKQSALANVFWPISQIYHAKMGNGQLSRIWEASLEQMAAENNKKIRLFLALGIQPQNALESQGLLHLHGAYCKELRCLQCPFGQQAMGRNLMAKEPEFLGMCQVA